MTDNDEPRSEPGHGTPEGYTSEEPAATELGQPGTPGAGMTPEAPHAADADAMEHGDAPAHGTRSDDDSTAMVAHQDTAATHMDTHTVVSDDDYGHAEAALGPIDWAAWSYAALGAVAAVVMVVLFAVAIS